MLSVIDGDRDTIKLINNYSSNIHANKYKHSKYNIVYKKTCNFYILYNTLYSTLAYLNSREYDVYNNITYSETEIINFFVKNGLLVDINIDEQINYVNESKKICSAKRKTFSVTILPTTKCNAKCFYCYEEGLIPNTMSLKTQDKVVDYLIKNAKYGNLRLTWFGGEPLLSSNIIDYITLQLSNRNLQFTSGIITNGSLINTVILEKIINNWKVKNIQITLDGINEEYEKRKSYVNNNIKFNTIISKIGLLAKENINITIRLNIDKNNIDSIEKLVAYLVNKFKMYKNVKIYPAFLVNVKDEINSDLEKIKVLEDIINISKQKRKGGLVNNLGMHFESLLKSKPRYSGCMINSDNSVVIDSKGYIYKCNHHVADIEKSIGSVHNMESYCNNKTNNKIFSDICNKCIFLPKCYTGCEYDRSVGKNGCISLPCEYIAALKTL